MARRVCFELVAVALHVADLITRSTRLHFAALLLVTAGFAVLTAISVFLEVRNKNGAATSRLAGAMVLFLFAISFAHFSSEHAHRPGPRKSRCTTRVYRWHCLCFCRTIDFLLLDAFLRFVVNATLAAAAVLGSIRIVESTAFRTEGSASLSTPGCYSSARVCCLRCSCTFATECKAG